MKISQFGALNHFVRVGDSSTPRQLADAFQVTKGAMTNTLKRLLDRDLITISPDPNDGRCKRVFITKKGRETREHCIQQMAPVIEILKKSFSQNDFESAIPFLTKLREFLDNERDLFLKK